MFRKSSVRTSSHHKHPPRCRDVGSSCCTVHVPHARSDSSRPQTSLPAALCLWWSPHSPHSLGPTPAISLCPTAVPTSHLPTKLPHSFSRLGSDQPFPAWCVPGNGRPTRSVTPTPQTACKRGSKGREQCLHSFGPTRRQREEDWKGHVQGFPAGQTSRHPSPERRAGVQLCSSQRRGWGV